LIQGFSFDKEYIMNEIFMKRAIELAAKGIGKVDPNPLVGAVIVKDQRIIGEGYHQFFGGPHAEVNAFINANESVEGADMYVTLEPCAHYGKTPPCALKIIDQKIKRVFISTLDPNPLVNGKGVQLLEDAGIEVYSGLMDQENRHLNRAFLKHIKTGMPYVIMKSAMTADGKTATYAFDSKWITNEKSRAYVHQIRTELMGIMVGVNTINKDDSKLTARVDQKDFRHPVRIILDTLLEINLNAYVVATSREIQTIVMTTNKASQQKIDVLESKGVNVIVCQQKDDEIDLFDAMKQIGKLGINSILLEGGSTVNFSALQSGIVDEVICFVAPKIIGGKNALTPVGGLGISKVSDAIALKLYDVIRFDDDVCLKYVVTKEAF
jgi:diaminohydroxyphosphoribosylaminopyrimidine deaminase / 5-amino-6-(5-phosphoribosylamino)uracil reductase